MKAGKLLLFSVFSVFLALSAICFSHAQDHPEKMIFMTMNYKDNAVTVKDIAVGNGFYTPFAEEENFNLDKCSLKVSDKSQEVLSTYFYVDNKRFEDIIDPETGDITGSMKELDDIDFSVIIPFYDPERIEIKCPANKIILNRRDINLTKELYIPPYTEVKTEGKKENKTDKNSEGISETENSGLQDKGGKKSLFLRLIGIIDRIFYYIFG